MAGVEARATGKRHASLKNKIFDGESIVAVAETAKPRPKMLVLNFPHNPTGADLPESGLQRILAAVKRVGARLFSDEVFRLLPGGGGAPNSMPRPLWSADHCQNAQSSQSKGTT